MTEVGGLNELATPWYSDQILPFDVTLAGANEYGAMCAAKIFGVEILNEGQGISIDDAVSEMQATFVARGVEPMQAVTSPWGNTLGGESRSRRPSRPRRPRARARGPGPRMSKYLLTGHGLVYAVVGQTPRDVLASLEDGGTQVFGQRQCPTTRGAT